MQETTWGRPDRPRMSPTSASSYVRVGSWNLLHEHTDYVERLDAAAASVADCDVVLLQEVARGDGYDAGRDLAHRIGYTVAAEAHTAHSRSAGHDNGTAILTRLPVVSSFRIPVTGTPEGFAAAWLTSSQGRPILAISAHLEWGAGKEHIRLGQVREIESAVQAQLAAQSGGDVEPIVILGGDLNAVPDSDTVRFLTGKGVVGGESTFWADAWDARAHQPELGMTSIPGVNPLAARTARSKGLNPSLIPARRIDYLLVRGWVWGKAGCPLHFEVRPAVSSTGVCVSDHELVVADLWDPAAH